MVGLMTRIVYKHSRQPKSHVLTFCYDFVFIVAFLYCFGSGSVRTVRKRNNVWFERTLDDISDWS